MPECSARDRVMVAFSDRNVGTCTFRVGNEFLISGEWPTL